MSTIAATVSPIHSRSTSVRADGSRARRAAERPQPLLVATDGRAGATPAVRMAQRLAARTGAPVHALAVLEPIPTYDTDASSEALDSVEQERAAGVYAAVHAQLRAAVGEEWPVQVTFGHTARAIAQVADERHARYVLTGLGRHGLGDRVFGTETALQLLRLGSRPVLAVAPEADGTLRRAVVAVDFGPSSVHAAALACSLLEPGGTLSLVHVKSRLELSQPTWEAWDAVYGTRVTELFQRLVAALRGGTLCDAAPGRRDVTIGTAILVGDPAEEIVDYATRVGADLVAVGSHGAGFVERLLVGSVATEILRRTSGALAACSVLAAPERGVLESAEIERQLAGTTETLDPSEWRLALEGFTRRNEGRRAVLEVDDPGLGAQAALRGYALVGATYDQRDRRAELMFGDPDHRGRHLTRSIGPVSSIAVLTAADGRDVALRVEHGKGQTLVTFGGG